MRGLVQTGHQKAEKAAKSRPGPARGRTITDWVIIDYLVPDVRLKQILEMRGADAGGAQMMQALPSFLAGLLYDSAALDAAWEIVKQWQLEDPQALHVGCAALRAAGKNSRAKRGRYCRRACQPVSAGIAAPCAL